MGRRTSVAASAQAQMQALVGQNPAVQKAVDDFKLALYQAAGDELKKKLGSVGLEKMSIEKLVRLVGSLEFQTKKPGTSIQMVSLPSADPEPPGDPRRARVIEGEALDLEGRRALRESHKRFSRRESGA